MTTVALVIGEAEIPYAVTIYHLGGTCIDCQLVFAAKVMRFVQYSNGLCCLLMMLKVYALAGIWYYW